MESGVILVLMTSPDRQFKFEGTTIYSFERKPGVWVTEIRFKALPEVSRQSVTALMLRPALPESANISFRT